MKLSSLFTFGAVLLVFFAIQGWLLARMFIAPRVFSATEAVMMGDQTDVRTPVQGMIKEVAVKENDQVMADQTLFVITRTVVNSETQEVRQEDFPILAFGPGVITGIQAKNGLFVQSAQKLALIINNSSDALYVQAKIPVQPNDVPRIQTHMTAKVRANFLFGGQPVDAMVTTVEPHYDANSRMLTVRLTLLRYPDGIEHLPLGLPVDAWVEQERTSNDNLVIAVFRKFFPNSEASSQE